MARTNPKSLSLSVQYACDPAGLPTRPQLRRWAGVALECDAVITIRFVDEAEGRALNHEYRGKGKDRDNATNVLSFPYDPPPQAVGDLVLCVPVVLDEAAAQGKPAAAHFAHLVVHGMLHLQGYMHDTDSAALRMEAREREILARLGIPDPY
ncbi:MAG: rRNA maturation RNase YbeY [Proteobacteria bacterium]|nr:rRNA maturation RNase YbeY [Pseudomonadota bacterium]